MHQHKYSFYSLTLSRLSQPSPTVIVANRNKFYLQLPITPVLVFLKLMGPLYLESRFPTKFPYLLTLLRLYVLRISSFFTALGSLYSVCLAVEGENVFFQSDTQGLILSAKFSHNLYLPYSAISAIQMFKAVVIGNKKRVIRFLSLTNAFLMNISSVLVNASPQNIYYGTGVRFGYHVIRRKIGKKKFV